MLTFGFYIGVCIESFILFLIVDVSEIHYQQKYGDIHINSTLSSYIIAIWIYLFIILSLWQWLKSFKPEVFETQKYFLILVKGFKPSWIWRSYWFVFLVRRTLFISIIFFMEDNDRMEKLFYFVVIQGLYFLYVLILRPHDSVKENLNDFVNEIFFLFFITFLTYFNDADKWNDTATNAYFWILMSNNFILISIVLGKKANYYCVASTTISIVVKIRNFFKKNKVKPKPKNETTDVGNLFLYYPKAKI